MTSINEDTVTFLIRTEVDLHVAVISVKKIPFLLPFSEVDVAVLSTVVSELGSNILKYAKKGKIDLKPIRTSHQFGIEIIAEDTGPGIADVDKALTDHYSTSGSLGLGLPSVKRMMSEFSIEAPLGKGTRIVAKKWLSVSGENEKLIKYKPYLEKMRAPLHLECATSNRPCKGERVSGDGSVVQEVPHGLLLAIIDASGHGSTAHEMTQKLVSIIQAEGSADIGGLLKRLHESAIATIGAAVGLAFIDPVVRQLSYVGIGNTRIRNKSAQSWTGISKDGILGGNPRSPYLQNFNIMPGDVILMYTDGLTETNLHQQLSKLDTHLSAQAIADQLVEKTGRPIDDASCLIIKCLNT